MIKVLTMGVIALMLSYGLAFAEEDTVLARIGDKKITLSDFNRIVSYYDLDKQKILEQKPQFKAALLERLVQAFVVSKIAKENGFDKKVDIREQVELLVDDYLTIEYIKREVIAKINVTEDDMKLYYKAHQDEFKTPEMVRARHILVKVGKSASQEVKSKSKEKIEEILKRIKSGEDFAKVASEVSDDTGSKEKGGDLGFFRRGMMVSEFEKAAFSLKLGEVSDIVETQFGFHIIKVEEKKESVLEPYEKVKEKVKEKVFNDQRKSKVEEFIEKAMKDAGVELNLSPLTFPKPE